MSTNITIKEAANTLDISEQRARTLCRTGILSATKFGRSWMLEKDSVNHYGLQSAHLVAEDHATYYVHKDNNIKPIALSFFSGAMGLDLGIEKAGFDVRLACEIDKYCRQTIALNKPNMALLSDINNYSKHDILDASGLSKTDEIDLVIGGPPCQAFSTAGKRKAFNDDRGNVFLKYIDLAIELNPKCIVIENVRGLLSCPMDHRPHDERGPEFPDLTADEMKGGALNFVLSKLKKSGYSYSFNLYNSANFGSPQIRERVIIVCARDGETPPYLTPTHSEKKEYGLPKWKTFKQAAKGLTEHQHLNFPEKRLKYYRMLKSGENWRNLPEALQKEALGKSYYAGGGKTGFLRRLGWNKPSPTVVTHPAMPATDLAHPEEDRPLSIQEYKRIQEFPDNWELAGPLIQQYKQVGNAVPSSLGFAVGKLIVSLLNKEKIEQFNGFCYSRYKNTSNLEWEEQFLKAYNNAVQPHFTQQEIQFG
ncbi:MAG: DNA cytosine methyltransferase [Gammaproteobacteria bacterium]|nr:DNA cytosine methyltransferase [Gammaproteobacteria bacterium]